MSLWENLTIYNLSAYSPLITQRDVTQTLCVRISPVLIVKITGKLPHTFKMILLIIPFDRGREYC